MFTTTLTTLTTELQSELQQARDQLVELHKSVEHIVHSKGAVEEAVQLVLVDNGHLTVALQQSQSRGVALENEVRHLRLLVGNGDGEEVSLPTNSTESTTATATATATSGPGNNNLTVNAIVMRKKVSFSETTGSRLSSSDAT
jgi:hypothetical protein